MDVSYHVESYPDLGVDEFVEVLVRSTLAERRPGLGTRQFVDAANAGNQIATSAKAGAGKRRNRH